MSDIVPIWADHSTRRSLLTYWPEKDTKPHGPQSIISLAKKAGLKQCFGISNNFHTFIEAWKGLKDAGIQFCFGLELIMVQDAKIHTEETLRQEHKILIFAKNAQAYKDLIKIYSACHSDKDNRYYVQRFDYKRLNALWTDNLMLVMPFFDGFLHKNTLVHGANIIPDMPVKPLIFREVDSGIPFAGLIDAAIDRFNANKDHEEVRTKTIYYEKRADFEAYTVLRSIQNRGSFDSPKVDFLCSPRFCFEEWERISK